MLFGYARVSTENQKLDSQIDALTAFGVEKHNIYADTDSGKKTDRKELEMLLNQLRTGDMVVFYDLTRIGRNLKHLITIMDFFSEHKIEFKDLTNPAIDTKSMETPAGKLIFVLFGALGEFFREQSNEKVRAGLASARRKGKFGGRPKGLSEKLKKIAPAVASMYKDPNVSINDIRKAFGIAQGSVYKCLQHQKVNYQKTHKNKGNNNRIKNTKIKQ